MAAVYILWESNLDKFYTGSCKNLDERIAEHKSKIRNAYTSNSDDWQLFLVFEYLTYSEARLIESHIKSMKSKTYIQNLKKYPEMRSKLINRYKSAGSSR